MLVKEDKLCKKYLGENRLYSLITYGEDTDIGKEFRDRLKHKSAMYESGSSNHHENVYSTERKYQLSV